jgi:hypothetical protein
MDSAGMVGAAKAAAARKRGRREFIFEVMRNGGQEDKRSKSAEPQECLEMRGGGGGYEGTRAGGPERQIRKPEAQ